MDIPLQQYRDGKKRKKVKKEMIDVYATYLCNLFM